MTVDVDLDPERKLAAAVFQRAAADLAGRHVRCIDTREERAAAYEAYRWIEQGGPGFRFWADVAGRDWRRARAGLLRRPWGQ